MTTYLTSADAARVLDLSPSAVRLMARLGTLRVSARTEGGISLFRRQDVERLAARRTLLHRNQGRS
ncbi:MAG: helix-turn-helix domain-containing protein [Gemmatimonadaceae bacterium]